MAELSQAAADTFVHTRLERIEAGYDAAHFLSMIATAEFFSFLFAYLGVAALVIFRGGGVHNPQIIAEQIVAALIALGVVWVMYRVQTRLVLPVAGLFILAFAISYASGLSPGNVLGYSMVPTVASWLAVLWYFAWLAAVLYQFGRATWQVSRLSEPERLIARGAAQRGAAGYLMQLLGIPAICGWLGPLQRRVSILLFFLTTAVFSLFVGGLWNSFFTYLPIIEFLSRDVFECYSASPMAPTCNGMLVTWLLSAVFFFPVAFALNLAVVAGLRFAARRFTRLSLERLISDDERPVILFLRSFHDDQVRLQKPPRRLFRGLVSVGEPRPTLDHVLLEEGTPHGPVVAIGRPGSTPPFGAARIYVTDEEWRENRFRSVQPCRRRGDDAGRDRRRALGIGSSLRPELRTQDAVFVAAPARAARRGGADAASGFDALEGAERLGHTDLRGRKKRATVLHRLVLARRRQGRSVHVVAHILPGLSSRSPRLSEPLGRALRNAARNTR
jgi:hypothetical protein